MAFSSRRVKTLDKMKRMIECGIDNNEAVVNLYRQATKNGTNPHTSMGYVFGDWLKRSNEGQTMSQFTRGWLTADAEPLIAAGEESSDIPRALDNYIFVSEKKKEISRTVRAVLKTPAMNLALIIVYLWVIAYKMTPVFEQAVPRSIWGGSLYAVALLGDLVKDDLIYLLIGIGTLVVFIIWSMNNMLGRTRVSFDKFPPWSIYRQLYGANFMLSFAALYGAGMKDADIIRTLLKSANKYYSERLRTFLKHIDRGEKIGDTLAISKFGFPDRELVADMQIYQKLPDLPTVLQKVARTWTESNIENIKAATNLIAGILTMISFIVVALMTQSNFAFVTLVEKYNSR
jgi:type II secretory pathway component PulF